MNSASSSTETKKARFLPFFGLTLKQNWTSGFLIAIIYFFTLVVPTMFTVSSKSEWFQPEERQKMLLVYSRDLMVGLRYFIVPVTAILAVVMTCVMLRYLKNKVAVDFYHSLPIGRRRLYLTRMLAGYLMVLVPLILMTAVSTAILAANGAMNQTVFDMVVKLFSDSVLYSLVYYGLGAVVGMISGVTGVHLVLTGVAVFLPPAIYFLVVSFLDVSSENMWSGWYLNDRTLSLLSPAIRFFIADRTGIGYAAALLAAAAVLIVGAYFIYKYRKSERAGESIVFAPLRGVIKYLVIAPMTLGVGLLFMLITSSRAWMVFGFVCGAALSFLLANTIIYRSAKAMLRGLVGFIVYSAAATLCIGAVMINAFGFLDSVPSAGALSSVEMCIDSATGLFSYYEPDNISTILSIYDKLTDEKQKGSDTSYADTSYADNNYISVYFVFRPKFGIPRAKSVTVNGRYFIDDEIKTITNSEEFRQQYIGMLDTQISGWNMPLSGDDSDKFATSDERNAMLNELSEALKLDYADVSYESFNGETTIGYARLYNGYGVARYYSPTETIYVPIYPSMKNTEAVLKKYGQIRKDFDEALEDYNSGFTEVAVVNTKTLETMTFTDPDEIREILDSFSTLATTERYYYTYLSPFTSVSTDYTVGCKGDSVEYEVSRDPDDTGFNYIILKDRVPDVIKESFDK